MSRIARYFLIISLFVLALGLRLWLVETQPYWEDEQWAVYFARTDYTVWEHLTKPLDDRPAFYPLALKLLLHYGWSYSALRLVTVFFSMATLAVLALWWRRMGQRHLVIGLLLGSFSLFLLHFAWEIREYSWLLFLGASQMCLAAFWYKKQLDQKLIPLWWWVTWSVISFLGVFTNYTYLPFLIGLYLAGILLCGLEHKHFLNLKTFFGHFVALLPMAAMTAFYLFGHNQLDYVMVTTQAFHRPTFFSVINQGLILLNMSTQYQDDTVYPLTKVLPQLLIVLPILFSGLCWLSWRVWSARTEKPTQWRLFVFCGLTILFTVELINLLSFLSPIVAVRSRFLAPLGGFSLMWLTLALSEFWRQADKIVKVGFVLVGIFWFGWTVQAIIQIYHLDKSPNRQAIQTITALKPQLGRNSQIVFSPQYQQQYFPSFYWPNAKENLLLGTKTCSDETMQSFQGQQLWLVTDIYDYRYAGGEVIRKACLLSHCKTPLNQVYDFGRYIISECEL
jgi:hypothetical protein